MKYKCLVFLMFFLLNGSLLAKEFSVELNTYAIKEPDLLEIIRSKLNSMEETGSLEAHQQKIKEHITNSIRNPEGLTSVRRAEENREFYYDPTIISEKDITDGSGKVIVKKGKKINPLETISYDKELVFIQGNDRSQLEWYFNEYLKDSAKLGSSNSNNISSKECSNNTDSNSGKLSRALSKKHKLILVSGSPIELSEHLGIQVYFDQGGYITEKLGIRAVPAIVKQEGERFKVQEICLEDNNEIGS